MDLLSDILNLMKLSGTLYFRTSFMSPWAIEVPTFENASRFHYAHRGRCFIHVDGLADPVLLQQGDLIIVPHGARHIMADPVDTVPQTVDAVVAASGFTGSGTLVYGPTDGDTASGFETQLICGQFAFDTGAWHRLLDALPPAIVISDYSGAAPDWLDNSLRIIGAEAGQDTMGADLIALKMSEIIFTQAIRKYLETDGANRPGLAGFADPHISRALEAMHTDPAKDWTVESLAGIAGMSRTAFATRFNTAVDSPPLTYLTEWRMQLARRMLLESDVPVIEVAEHTGYTSEASFGRVFKRHFDMGPASYRRSAL